MRYLIVLKVTGAHPAVGGTLMLPISVMLRRPPCWRPSQGVALLLFRRQGQAVVISALVLGVVPNPATARMAQGYFPILESGGGSGLLRPATTSNGNINLETSSRRKSWAAYFCVTEAQLTDAVRHTEPREIAIRSYFTAKGITFCK